MKSEHLPTFRFYLLIFALGLGTFIQILDIFVANVAIPSIANNFHVTIQQGTWIITSFAVSNAIVLPLTGWLAKRFGPITLFISATSLFSLASLLCGIATSFPALVTFRIFQGAVAGVLIPLSQTLLLSHAPKNMKGTALGFWSMVVVTAPLMGPVIGGWLTSTFGWRSVFYINVPIGFFSAFLTGWLLKGMENSKAKSSIDYIGLGLLAIGVGALQVFLDKGADLQWFSSTLITTLSVIALVSLICFVIWSQRVKHPVVNLSLFKDVNFRFATMVSASAYVMIFGTTVLIPLWLQTHMGYSPLKAGLAVMPSGILPIILSPIIGKFAHQMSMRLLASMSLLVLSITNFWYSFFTDDVTLQMLMWPRFVLGLGVVLLFIPVFTLAMANVPKHDLAGASGLYNFVRIIAGAGVGTALYVTFWLRFGINDLMWISGWAALFLIPLLWFCKEPKEEKADVEVVPN